MPYSKENPPDKIKGLPEHAQHIWMAAFNSAYKQYNGNEQKAFSIAWAAVNKYKSESMHSDFERIFLTFIKHYGDELGHEKFDNFIKLNKLKVEKPYTPQAQFMEKFSWVEPLISFYRQDKEAKYYRSGIPRWF